MAKEQKANERGPRTGTVRGEDWVRFVLKAEAPDYVVIGRARFSQIFRRANQPFRVTRGEWRVYVEKTGYFEEESGIGKERK